MADDEARTQEAFAAARRGEAQAVFNLVASAPRLVAARDDANGWTLLHVFARLSLSQVCTQLIAVGADVEARDKTFRSPLHLAARADASPSLPDACTAGASPASATAAAEAQSEDARSARAVATVSALLKAGARVTARDSFGFTPLHHSAQAGHTALVDLLLSLNTALRLPRAPLEAETNAEERPLHLAAQGGHAVTVKRLLAQGAHPEKTNYLGQTGGRRALPRAPARPNLAGPLPAAAGPHRQ